MIVTGAAQGIGQATAQLATREGANVLALDVNGTGLEETARLVASEGGTPLTAICDVTLRDQIDAAVATAVDRYGTVDVLVNTATAFTPAPFEEQTDADLRLALDVNVFGTFHSMLACFPHMRERGGRIINFASASGTRGSRNRSTYNAAKEAVRGLTKSAANEWGRFQITVNALIPMANSPTFRNTIDDEGGEAFLQQMLKALPLGRVGDPLTDIAPAVVFLASDAARFITGRTLMVDGGGGSFM
jgi:NAD(P)-dependent dehydrogenase (short-subunit alcohol dehydrogenase family)